MARFFKGTVGLYAQAGPALALVDDGQEDDVKLMLGLVLKLRWRQKAVARCRGRD